MNLAVPYIERWAGTITPNYVTKAEGIRLILKERDGGREDAVAVENIKAAADYVTAPLKEDGLWKAFDHLGLLK